MRILKETHYPLRFENLSKVTNLPRERALTCASLSEGIKRSLSQTRHPLPCAGVRNNGENGDIYDIERQQDDAVAFGDDVATAEQEQ